MGLIVNKQTDLTDFNLIRKQQMAIKFSQSGGKITITAKQTKECITISVSGTGIGIDKKDIRKLFKIEASYSILRTNNEMGAVLGSFFAKNLCISTMAKYGLKQTKERYNHAFYYPSSII